MVHYVIVRNDLPHGVQVAQTVHAAGESAGGPLPDGTIAVALSAPSEAAIRKLAQDFARQAIAHRLIVEDAGPWAGQAMAIGVTPTCDRKTIRRLTSRLPCVK